VPPPTVIGFDQITGKSNFTEINPSLNSLLFQQKLDTLCYSPVKTASSNVHTFWHNTGVWRTDRQKCYS